MQRLELKLSNRKGFTLILSALLIFVFIGAAVMAVDVGHMQLRRADVHAASDAAALAGIEEYQTIGRADSALLEAQAFTGKFKADASTLTLAAGDFALGFWNGTTFSAGGADTNAAQATVRFTGNLTFAPALFGHISSHASAATSVAVGIVRSVTKSTCVSPTVISYQALLNQLKNGKGMGDSLTPADLDSLAKAGSSMAVSFDIPNGTQVSSLDPNEFYQINVPPRETAGGTIQNSGPPSSSDYRNGFTCTGGNPEIGIGDYVQPDNGQKAQQTKKAITDIGPLPVTLEVLIADQFGGSPNGGCTGGPGGGGLNGCFRVKYLGAFTVTDVQGKGISGFFRLLDPLSGGVTGTSNTALGPVQQSRIRLVY